ncbi:ABC transporter ATP-binding protein [uncultured Thiodictyon sp.]|uniref:ABC transporter ATP-binding protein n=1 Tax=uncultured Thiodictyon sp. TaxID=1846217 RepID=UPI0025D51736|nr:ABC transporter ATP-binding protein [uncultured Thiodictyon sp.]
MTAAIRLDAVTRRFASGIAALADISFEVPAGQFAAVLGPSGCGKTTLLRMIAGLDRACSGVVAVGTDAALAQTSCVFQDATLMPWATLYDNVSLPLRIQGTPRADARRRIEPTLEAIGLGRFADAYPGELSGGMRMRASIARALVTHPRLLLMDEPFAALDEITRARLNDDLLALWQVHGFTTVFVTHSVFEAVYLSQRVLVMSARPGRVIADLAVDLPYPRPPDLRLTPAYASLCRAVSAALESGYVDGGRQATLQDH